MYREEINMRLFLTSIRRQAIPAFAVGIIYAIVLMALIVINNSNSMIYYQISPYTYASEPIDFFFGLIVSIPFSIYTFFMKKDNFLDYVHVRISRKKYVLIHIFSTMTICFLMVFIANIIGVVFSCNIANIVESSNKPDLSNYIFGELQMSKPIVFGILWSLQKALIGSIICLFSQITALYIENLFLSLILPFAYIVVENFITSILGLSRFSITTTFVLNRLTPMSMTITNITIGSICFILIIAIIGTVLRRRLNGEKV